MDNTITTLEFCAGYGGIGLGLKNIFGERMRTIAYCELEGFAQANLISKMEKGLMDAAPIWNDLKTFPYESFHGLVDIFVAGYPCQPFSSAGKRAGKDDPRHLWPWIADGIRLFQPRMCFFENVEGHISLGLSTVISDLEELGYKSSFGIFSASEVGAPHQRKRVFIMAVSNSLGGAAGLSRSLAWNEGFTGVSDNGGGEGCCYVAHNKGWTGRGLSERTQEKVSEFGFNCEAELADSNSRRMFGSGNELGNFGDVGQGWSNTSQNGIVGNVWPSRPGQPQYSWEPPRVVGNASQLFCDGSNNNKGVIKQGEQIPEFGNSSWEATMGNTNCWRLSSGIDTRSCSETDSGRKDNIEQTECGKIEPEMGRDIDGHTYRVDISELSGLCDSELAEIREWMVKGDNRTDELRSCGNGVVPATAERAFRTLLEELINK